LCEGTPPAHLISDLQPESALLISLNQRFPSSCKNARIISCYETYETTGPKLKDPKNPSLGFDRGGPLSFQVPRTSACLDWSEDWETRIPIHADHSEIAKLDNSIGSPYHEIRKEIEKIAKKAEGMKRRRLEEPKINQDVLDLFIVLQYELSWFNSLRNGTIGLLGARHRVALESPGEAQESVPYGHPAYLFAAEAVWIIETLNNFLLQRHTASTAAEDSAV
jgi:hypothetical protein